MRLLAFFYWDPHREAFFIPFIHHPVMWYGIFFALGFVLSYLIIYRLFLHTISRHPYLSEAQITDWKALLENFQDPQAAQNPTLQEIVSHLDRKMRKDLFALKQGEPISDNLKQALISSINKTVEDRRQMENLFPHAVLKMEDLSRRITDRFTWYVILGTIIGARLGHILFYDLPFYVQNPIKIFEIWEGGLASHGGAVGILLAVVFFSYRLRSLLPGFTLLNLLDHIAIVVPLAGCCIRIGNFFNQEISGPPTMLPWAVVFGHPFEGGAGIPRHPTQLYEAIAYFLIFVGLFFLWKMRGDKLLPGVTFGWMLFFIFGFRFLIEFVKLPQESSLLDHSFLQMGQYLSIPFILAGAFFILRGLKSLFRKEKPSKLVF